MAKKKAPAKRAPRKRAPKAPAGTVPSKGGRPLTLTEALADEICIRLACGEALISICEDETMPGYRTVMTWLQQGSKPDGPELQRQFRHKYTQAREDQQETLLDEVLVIADDGRNDYMKKLERGGVIEVVNNEAIQRSRLRVDARMKLAEKMAPKKYGQRVDLNHGGQVENPIQAIMRRISSKPYVPPGADGVLGGK